MAHTAPTKIEAHRSFIDGKSANIKAKIEAASKVLGYNSTPTTVEDLEHQLSAAEQGLEGLDEAYDRMNDALDKWIHMLAHHLDEEEHGIFDEKLVSHSSHAVRVRGLNWSSGRAPKDTCISLQLRWRRQQTHPPSKTVLSSPAPARISTTATKTRTKVKLPPAIQSEPVSAQNPSSQGLRHLKTNRVLAIALVRLCQLWALQIRWNKGNQDHQLQQRQDTASQLPSPAAQ